jgi:hypothetical protein
MLVRRLRQWLDCAETAYHYSVAANMRSMRWPLSTRLARRPRAFSFSNGVASQRLARVFLECSWTQALHQSATKGSCRDLL